MEIRKYKVTYWMFSDSPQDRIAEVEAYDAKDAVYQVSLLKTEFVKQNPGWTFSIRNVEPLSDPALKM